MTKQSRRLIIHDLSEDEICALSLQNENLLGTGEMIRHCMGCFGCWTRTPAQCVIRDGYEQIGKQFSACDELVVVSRCVYGGFSSAVKSILDRCIGYLLPFFTIRDDGKMHHASRYEKQLRLRVHFYGQDITVEEQETARELTRRNALNLHALDSSVAFHKEITEMGGAMSCGS